MKILNQRSKCMLTLLAAVPLISEFASAQPQKWIESPKSLSEENTKLHTETTYYKSEFTTIDTVGRTLLFNERRDLEEQPKIKEPQKPDTDEFYKPENKDSYRTIYRNSSGEKVYESGMFELSTGLINETIDDLDFYDFIARTTLTLPDDAFVTNVEYKIRVSYVGEPTSFACEDYDIYLYSERELPTGTYYNVYNNLGSLTDGGFDLQYSPLMEYHQGRLCRR